MIEGDIDLTEGLDFYREKKTLEDKVYLPILRAFNKMPWAKEKHKPSKNWLNRCAEDGINADSARDIEMNGAWTSTDTNYSRMVDNLTLYMDNQEISIGTYNIDDSTYMYYDARWHALSYCINQTSNTTNSWYTNSWYSAYDIDNNSTSITLSNNNLIRWSNWNSSLEIYAEPVKKSIFKYREIGASLKKLLEESVLEICKQCHRHYFPTIGYSSICPECRKKEEHEYGEDLKRIKAIFSSRNRKDVIKKLIDEYDLTYWYSSDNWNWSTAFEEDDDGFDTQSDLFQGCYIRGIRLDRIGVERGEDMASHNETRKVPWLRRLSYTNYNSYMKDLWDEYDEKNMEYLTRMSWIGVHKTEHVYN